MLEDGLAYVIEARETAAECVQQAAVWWEESDLSQKLTDTAESLCAAWNNSPIGQFCDKAANSISDFYEKHKTAINIAIGVAVIAVCAVAAVATGGMGCCLLAVAAKGALSGAVIGAVTGTAGGALNSAIDYMEENGTLDGAGGAILEGASTGFAAGSIAGAADGFAGGAMKYMKNPGGYCFLAGTLVVTTLGLVDIESIRPGDYVYAKNVETGEQAYMPVLETYEREVAVTYTVTINGEAIETTDEHPFFTIDNGWTCAKDLKAGDKVELSDGSSGEVDSVEKNELDEPVTVYNFNVMDYHTYYVSDSEVLVHNTCKNPMTGTKNKSSDVFDGNGTSKRNSGSLNEETFTRYLSDGRQTTDVSNLPGSAGIKTPRRLSTDEMTFLTQEYGVEFAQVYKYGNGINGRGGQYYLYSGTANKVTVPIGNDIMLINHTHPGGTAYASMADKNLLRRYQQFGSPQRSSEIIPIGKENIRFSAN